MDHNHPCVPGSAPGPRDPTAPWGLSYHSSVDDQKERRLCSWFRPLSAHELPLNAALYWGSGASHSEFRPCMLALKGRLSGCVPASLSARPLSSANERHLAVADAVGRPASSQAGSSIGWMRYGAPSTGPAGSSESCPHSLSASGFLLVCFSCEINSMSMLEHTLL